MQKHYTAFFLLLFILPFTSFSQSFDPVEKVKQDMVEASHQLMRVLYSEQLEKLKHPFEDEERKIWNNLPTHSFLREGLPLGDLNAAQKMALHAFLQSALSEQGYLKVQNIIQQDQNRRMEVFEEYGFETNMTMYGHDYYYLTLFGEPSMTSAWGWRFEGHHISLHFTLTPEGISVTPMFVGVDPREVTEGPYAGYTFMHEETCEGWRLINSFTEEQNTAALLDGKMPDDVLTREGDEPHTQKAQGLAFSDMSASQQDAVKTLIRAWVYNLAYPLAEQEMEEIMNAGLDKLHFAWAGDKGQHEARYYRIQGPACIIEYDNRSYESWHIHSLWRNLSEDFGKEVVVGK
ncbi:DUF3500 domain-containing protein [Catalinimonas niigatensis]|uniref:DUF3500 domain-containing protein n=1 Tax=Catalinimonas niigatensis TaxID=1397264 RepID=UPI00266574DD|nr:DUF3500 domain-containing protein [Catalinimonas niigatensis]WPP49593.1 DUF3500 domain-containing protein [Catalinimonas niigatensis]